MREVFCLIATRFSRELEALRLIDEAERDNAETLRLRLETKRLGVESQGLNAGSRSH